MGRWTLVCCLLWLSELSLPLLAQEPTVWPQWRGPTRDGLVGGEPWPASLSEQVLKQTWRVDLPPSYSGPIVGPTLVYTTGTIDKKNEVVIAYDRQTGQERWRREWPGALSVPFFAASNGSWIRATPALHGDLLFVAGIRDVLVALDAATGEERWRVDFVEKFKSPVPSFGFVSSPLVDGDALYVQAGAAVVKLKASTGEVVWRALQDDGGMMGSAFSSPIIATLHGQRQLIVQTRQNLAGVDLEQGTVLWQHKVPSFRGMNILTPTPVGDAIFTSSYQNRSWLFKTVKADGQYQVEEAWRNTAQGYMSSPVVIGGHAYLHLQNQRFTCINLATGERTWTSEPFGKYCSLVAQGDRILALDQRGKLLLIAADPQAFRLLDERTLTDQETWAHLALCGDELFIRALDHLAAYRWRKP